MDRDAKARLVAKILRGPPYEIETMEEFNHFFSNVTPDMELAACYAYYTLAEKKHFVVKVRDEDGEDGEGGSV